MAPGRRSAPDRLPGPTPTRKRLARTAAVLVLTLAAGAGALQVAGPASADAAPVPGPSLREVAAAKGLTVGAVVATDPFLGGEQPYLDTLAAQYSSTGPENFMKWDHLQPRRGEFDFAAADQLVAFAEANDMEIYAHVLAWYSQLPDWVQQITDEAEARQVLETHVKTVVGRYKGRIASWDVVNEAFSETGARRSPAQSFWERVIGPEYVELAFRWAHEADPQALLYLNDFDNEEVNPKSNGQYALARELVADGVPIHGVGFQMHVAASWRLTDSFRRNADRFAALGLKIAVTEFDARIELPVTDADLAQQAGAYADLARFCREQPACVKITTWGFTDKHSWIPQFFDGFGAALPLGEDFAVKPAFVALRDGLAAEPTAVPSPVRVLDAIGSAGGARIVWAGQIGATGYTVTYRPVTGGAPVTVDAGRATSVALDDLDDGTAYVVTVAATNALGTGPASEPAEVTPVAGTPAAPTLTSVTAGNRVVTAAWEPVPGATGYVLKYGTVPGVYSENLDLGTATSFRITGLANGTPHHVAVAAYNGNGEGPTSPPRTVTPAKPPTPTLDAPETAGPVTVDGVLDEATWTSLPIRVEEPVVGTSDNTSTAAVSWDGEYLYVGATILDADLRNDSTATYQDDALEVYLDGNGDGAAAYDRRHDRQFFVGQGDAALTEQAGRTRGVRVAQTVVDGGWAVELAVPWGNIHTRPVPGTRIGIDVGVDDDDDGGVREGQETAFGVAENYADLSNLAQATLVGRTATTRAALTPVAECVTRDGEGTWTARFGYDNANDGRVTLAARRPSNLVTPGPVDQGQPASFLRGRHRGAFTVDFRRGGVSWVLRGPDGRVRVATASPVTPRCPAAPVTTRAVLGDGPAEGWTSFTYNATADLGATSPVRSGAVSAAVGITGPFGLVGFETRTPAATTFDTAVTFWVHGGEGTGERALQVSTSADGVGSIQVPVDVPSGTWTEVTVPAADLGDPERIGVLLVQDRTGGAQGQPTFFLDDVRLTGLAPQVP